MHDLRLSSEVHIELRDETDNHDEENAQKEDLQSDEPSVRETVLLTRTAHRN